MNQKVDVYLNTRVCCLNQASLLHHLRSCIPPVSVDVYQIRYSDFREQRAIAALESSLQYFQSGSLVVPPSTLGKWQG